MVWIAMQDYFNLRVSVPIDGCTICARRSMKGSSPPVYTSFYGTVGLCINEDEKRVVMLMFVEPAFNDRSESWQMRAARLDFAGEHVQNWTLNIFIEVF